MAVVVALFLGLMVSAEELFRDRKIIIREKFLNISRFSYLFSKITFLFVLSAIQSFLFIFVSGAILEIKGMFLQQWLILFSTACYGNLVGLNISSGMRTVVSIYILIPLILVPQLLLGGAMINFDDLHKSITNKEYVPVIGDLMATRWSYEAIMVEGFRDNRYNRATFDYRLEIEQNNYYKDELIKNLRDQVVNYILQRQKNPAEQENISRKLKLLKYHVLQIECLTGIKPGKWIDKLNLNSFNQLTADAVNSFFNEANDYFIAENREFREKITEIENSLYDRLDENSIARLATDYNNQRLADIVLNQGDLKALPYYEKKNRWIQKSTPIFMKPTSVTGRAHFFAPYKQVGGLQINTLAFNIIAIWIMVFFLYLALYYNLLKRFIDYLESMRIPLWRKFGRQGL
jgi:hypothetical protein